MKSLKLSIFLLVLVAMFSVSVFAQSGESVTVNVGDSGTLAKSKLVIKFVKVIEDSRCPADVNCIWAGNAKIEVEITKGSKSKTFVLNTTGNETAANFANYSVTFTDLKPEKTTGTDGEDKKDKPCSVPYKATFTVEKIAK